jgi:hypothetical protein
MSMFIDARQGASRKVENIAPIQHTTSEQLDAVDAALSWHDGDSRATIEPLLQERSQLAVAHSFLSRGGYPWLDPETRTRRPSW